VTFQKDVTALRLMGATVLAFVAAAMAGAVTGEAPVPTAEDFLRRFDARQKGVFDFTAAFEQSYRSGALKREIRESGTLKVLRPLRMSFEYERPEKKRFVADGASYYFHVPKDRQVIVRNQQGDRRAAARVLAGDGLLAAFRIEKEDKAPSPETRRFRLIPQEPDPDAPRVAVEIGLDLSLRSLEIDDGTGGRSRLTFSRIKENVGLKSKDFRFVIPKGVEVIS
jgi:outer membrane lipoprotein carrier protein